MQGIKFIIGIKSFLLRSGLEGVINEFKGAELLASTDSIDALIKLIGQERYHFLIIDTEILVELHGQNLGDKSKVILVQNNNSRASGLPACTSVVYINDSKTEIVEKIGLATKAVSSKVYKEDSSALSEREQDVVRQIALGGSNKEIAGTLFISVHTVMTHRKNITKKLGIKTVSGLTVYAILNKIINIGDV